MKKNVLSPLFGFGVILISLFLLSACQPSVQVAAAVQPKEAAVSAMDSVDFNVSNAAETSASGLATVHAADRKFFYAGNPYSVPAALHPADRKFSYTREVYDTSVTIQPASRKSFYDGALYPAGH